MVQRIDPKDTSVTIKFGGGLHTRASEDEIDDREASGGANFILDLQNRELRNRKPFDLIGTVPNEAGIRGGFSLLKSDGTVKFAIQAGATVYEWDGATTFTPIGTVNASAKLRGHWRSHQWTLDDKVLITDLNLADTIKEWDGSTFQSVTFTNEVGAGFGSFYAKYLTVSNERAVFSHVKAGSTTSPHMIVGCERGDYTIISNAQRPASALSVEDPFFLLTPDLRPINGMVEAFGTTVISSEQGQLFNLTGSSAKDFAFSDFYAGSHASGSESMAYIGNDIIYGRKGRIESVRDTDRFGDSEADDITANIADVVGEYTGWTIVYNSRLNLAYCFPTGQSEVWVLNIAMRGGDLSPWMKWTTSHSLAFQPSLVMPMLDPADGLEYIFMGDDNGNLYRLEGTGSSGDGGFADIRTEWLTKRFSAPLDAEAFNVEGTLSYHKNTATTVQITFEWGGQTAYDQSVEVTLPALSDIPYFGDDIYFGGEVYFGVRFENRLLRQKFLAAGQGSDLQVRFVVEGSNDFRLNESVLRMTIVSQ